MKFNEFLRSRAGRRFYNFAYCWGACLVILGAVFKIAHMPFDSILLMIGLFTEVFIFFISGFDYPSDEYEWDRVFPQLKKGGKADMDLHTALDETRKKYSEGMAVLESRIKDLDKAYDAHVKRLSEATKSISPETLAEMQKETEEMTKLLKELNSKYSSMLEAMNTKRK